MIEMLALVKDSVALGVAIIVVWSLLSIVRNKKQEPKELLFIFFVSLSVCFTLLAVSELITITNSNIIILVFGAAIKEVFMLVGLFAGLIGVVYLYLYTHYKNKTLSDGFFLVLMTLSVIISLLYVIITKEIVMFTFLHGFTGILVAYIYPDLYLSIAVIFFLTYFFFNKQKLFGKFLFMLSTGFFIAFCASMLDSYNLSIYSAISSSVSLILYTVFYIIILCSFVRLMIKWIKVKK